MKYMGHEGTVCTEKARELVDHLHALMGGVKGTEKKDEGLCERLSPQEIQVALTLGRQGACTMGAIASAVHLCLSSVTALVDKLEAKKLVRRGRSGEDRRVVEVDFTEEGRRAHQQALACRVEFAKRVLGALSEKEQDQLLGILRKVAEALKEEEAAA